jgi:hypothetical protein
MVDAMHPSPRANSAQAVEFMSWTQTELGTKFHVSLEAQDKALTLKEAARVETQKREEAVARRRRQEAKATAEKDAQKRKDDAEWEAAEEARRQSTARKTVAREAEEKIKLEQAQEEAMDTLANIRGTMRGNIANIVGESERAAAAAY